MANSTSEELHIERIYNSVSVSKELDTSDIDSPIKRSWQRCIGEYGLSPANSLSPQVLDKVELCECQEAFSEKKELAQSSVDKLYGYIADIGYTILLTDNNGITLDCRYNPQYEDKLKKTGLYTGTNWSENISGTNGIGTCLMEKAPVLIRDGEHFFPEMLGITCTVSPIFDSKGKVMAALNASTLHPASKNQNKLISKLVEQHARQIEVLSFIRDFNEHWILKFSASKDTSDVITIGILAVNRDGVIVSGNKNAYNLLCEKFGSNLNNRFFHDVFKSNFSMLIDGFNRKSQISNQITTTETCNDFFFELTPPAINNTLSSASQKQSKYQRSKKAIKKTHPSLAALTGNDIHMQIISKKIKQIKDLDLHILLMGETGSGKEALAKAIHDESSRKNEPFIAINCAAIPDSLIESELFGYSSGTFTGALKKGMKGKVLEANGGTLFLDEIGDMPLHLQTRLLRVLSEMEVIPLGDTTPIYLDIQLISATNKGITEMIEKDTFRKDLYYRLNGITLDIPSLRDRTDKQELIINIFDKYASLKPSKISDEALDILKDYQWPGNIRELINVTKYSTAMCSDGLVLGEHLPKDIQSSQSNNIKDNLQISEYEILMSCLKVNKWNITNVSKQLGICRATVYRKINKYNIVSPKDL